MLLLRQASVLGPAVVGQRSMGPVTRLTSSAAYFGSGRAAGLHSDCSLHASVGPVLQSTVRNAASVESSKPLLCLRHFRSPQGLAFSKCFRQNSLMHHNPLIPRLSKFSSEFCREPCDVMLKVEHSVPILRLNISEYDFPPDEMAISYKCNSTSRNPSVRLPALYIKDNVIIDDLLRPSIESPIELPSFGNVEEKQAARMITIRKRKMRKHRLKKLRKRTKYLRLKIRQRRRSRREKKFQAKQMARINRAEAFSIQQYAKRVIRKSKEVPYNPYHQGVYYPKEHLDPIRAKQQATKELWKKRLYATYKKIV